MQAQFFQTPKSEMRSAMQDLVYSSVAEDFAGSPAAWDLRVRRGVDNAGAAGTGAAALEAAVQEAIATYQQALAAVPGAEMVALFAAFLREQLAAVLQEEGSAQGQARTTLQARGSALAVRLLELYSQATAAGSLSEGLALEWPKLHLRCGAPAAALDAARLAARALPHSAPVWQQLLALEACSAARGQLEQPSTLAEAGHGSGGASSSSSTDEEDGSGGAASEQGGSGWQLEGLVLEALRSVGPAEPAAAPLWLGGLQALVGVGGPLEGLCRLLVEAVSGQARGPLEVRSTCTCHLRACMLLPILVSLRLPNPPSPAVAAVSCCAPACVLTYHPGPLAAHLAGRLGRGGCRAAGGVGAHAGPGGSTGAVPTAAQAAGGRGRDDAHHLGPGAAGGAVWRRSGQAAQSAAAVGAV